MQFAQPHSATITVLPANRVRAWLFSLALLVYLADQLSKLWVLNTLDHFDQVVVIPGFFHLVHVRNSGAAFGILSDAAPWVRAAVLVGLSSLAVLALIVLLWRASASNAWGGAGARYGLALILGGAVGNIHDRLAYGNVVDFLDFFLGSWHWYTFNVADSGICVGTALLLIDLWRSAPPAATR
ncbi:MAG: signal peptidase II [Bryobacterales bacterium]|nr:signal peptidase II [Bryobacterales bacterium]